MGLEELTPSSSRQARPRFWQIADVFQWVILNENACDFFQFPVNFDTIGDKSALT